MKNLFPFFVFAAVHAVGGQTNAVPETTFEPETGLKVDAGADIRVRQEIMHNVVGNPGDPGYRSGGFVWSSPCTYIKLRDDVYIMTWVEQKWSGSFTTAAMNLRIMHDCGFSLGLTHDASKLLFHEMGAFARAAGTADMSGIFTLRHLD